MRSEENLTLTFTVAEWRLIAAACIRVKSTALLDGSAKMAILRGIAGHIASETGKDSEA